jgi:hypothetical protein
MPMSPIGLIRHRRAVSYAVWTHCGKNKNPPRYDFVWVDEIHEVIGSLVSLKVKAPGSGRWAVFDALKAMLSTSPRVLLTSASADEAVRDLCDACGLEAYWQMNGEPLLSHLKYELSHYDSSEVAFRQIDDALEAGKKIVLPCAEQKDLESILEHIKQKFPHKTTLRIDGTVQGGARIEAMARAREVVHDVLGYTASVDSGFSIDIIGYDLVFCRTDVRSVSATALMQMCQRVRHLSDNKIVLLCEPRAKDWDRYPGYRSERLATGDAMPGPMVDGDKLADAMRNLLTSTFPVAYFTNRRGRWRLVR